MASRPRGCPATASADDASASNPEVTGGPRHTTTDKTGRQQPPFGASADRPDGFAGAQLAPCDTPLLASVHPGPAAGARGARLCLFEFEELERAESREWSVDEEDLHRDVGLDVGL